MNDDTKDVGTAIVDGSAGVDPGFTPREILELALWIEKTGVEFYRMLSEDEDLSPDIKSFFLRLMGMEMEHEKLVRDMLAEQPEEQGRKLGFDEGLTHREYFLHLRALVEQRVFPEGLEFFATLDSMKAADDALPMALKIENESVNLYKTLAGFRMPYKTQGNVQKMIKEEESHVKDVQKIIDSLD